MPPLRERREEIPPLVEHYLRQVSDEQKKGNLSISDETLEYLVLYNWPGNIRQLANEVRRMVALADRDSTLTPALLSPEIHASRRTIAAVEPPTPKMRVRLDQPLPAAVDHLEQTMVRHALERSHGRVEEAARLLGISRKGLFLKRRRWGLGQSPADAVPGRVRPSHARLVRLALTTAQDAGVADQPAGAYRTPPKNDGSGMSRMVCRPGRPSGSSASS